MSASPREREQFIATMSKHNVSLDVTRGLLRYAATLQRLAEAQCNGDWPYQNGERKVAECAKCKDLWVPSVLLKGKQCPDCRTQALAAELVKAAGLEPVFQGDPRGYVFRVMVEGREIGVPS